jgi:hypothetical protein
MATPCAGASAVLSEGRATTTLMKRLAHFGNKRQRGSTVATLSCKIPAAYFPPSPI